MRNWKNALVWGCMAEVACVGAIAYVIALYSDYVPIWAFLTSLASIAILTVFVGANRDYLEDLLIRYFRKKKRARHVAARRARKNHLSKAKILGKVYH